MDVHIPIQAEGKRERKGRKKDEKDGQRPFATSVIWKRLSPQEQRVDSVVKKKVFIPSARVVIIIIVIIITVVHIRSIDKFVKSPRSPSGSTLEETEKNNRDKKLSWLVFYCFSTYLK